MPLALINGAALTENYIGNVSLKMGGERKEAALEGRDSCSAALLVMSSSGRRTDLMRAGLSSFPLPVPD